VKPSRAFELRVTDENASPSPLGASSWDLTKRGRAVAGRKRAIGGATSPSSEPSMGGGGGLLTFGLALRNEVIEDQEGTLLTERGKEGVNIEFGGTA